jgi:hypothetical protein
MVAAFQVVRPRAISSPWRVGKKFGFFVLSEPLGPDERREEVDDDEGGDRDRDDSHGGGSSDVFAGEDEGVANAHAHEAEREHRRQPDDQIHPRSF